MIVSFAAAQTMYKMRMNVREMQMGGEIECRNDTTVIWGNSADTISFLFNGKIRSFYEPTKETWKWYGHSEKLRLLAQEQSSTNVQLFLLQDRYNEIYSIRIVYIPPGYAIYISNVDYGMPNYIFSFNCNRCVADIE